MSVNFKPLAKPTVVNEFGAVWRWLQRVYEAVTLVQSGKLNCVTTVTLAAGVTTTALTHELIATTSEIVWSPRTAHAAAAMTSLYVSAKVNGSATLTHNNTADVDRTFDIAIIG